MSGRCPVCGARADDEPGLVCAACAARAVCAAHRRRVRGWNVSMSGGFAATHADDESACAQVTADGRCRVDGRAAHLGERRMGGTEVRLTD